MGYRNNHYFPHTNPYKYANHSSHVTKQRSTYKELLIYRAWATCDISYISCFYVTILFTDVFTKIQLCWIQTIYNVFLLATWPAYIFFYIFFTYTNLNHYLQNLCTSKTHGWTMRMVRANDAYGACERCVWSQSVIHHLCFLRLSSVTEDGSTYVCHGQCCQVNANSGLKWVRTWVLGWLAYSLGADIHRSVLRNWTEQVEADPYANHPRAVSLCGSICCCGSLSWCEGKKGAWQDGCCGGGGRGGCGSRKGTWKGGSCGGGGNRCGCSWCRVTRSVLLCLFGSRYQEISGFHRLPGMARYFLGLSQKPQLVSSSWVLVFVVSSKR